MRTEAGKMPESLIFPIRNGLGVSNDRFGVKTLPGPAKPAGGPTPGMPNRPPRPPGREKRWPESATAGERGWLKRGFSDKESYIGHTPIGHTPVWILFRKADFRPLFATPHTPRLVGELVGEAYPSPSVCIVELIGNVRTVQRHIIEYSCRQLTGNLILRIHIDRSNDSPFRWRVDTLVYTPDQTEVVADAQIRPQHDIAADPALAGPA